ncbi:MAG: hypothetical protein Q8Q89_05300 [bacterium]|nr:hypothetical protein [bacterium]
MPVYSLPIKLLVFNVKNGRFAADLENLELALGRKLNAWRPDDAKKVKQILLEKSAHDTKMFKENLKRQGQKDPGVITSAGVVINANRRMAILSELYEETGQAKYSVLDTSILPHGTSETEIYKVEAQLQYAKDFKQSFGAVNELLKIEEGLRHMPKRELVILLGRDERYIDEHIAQLNLLRAYSKYAWGRRVDYKKIEEEQITEIITDVEKNIRKFKSEGLRSVEINKLLEVQFAYIKSGCSYRDIRDVGKYSRLPNVEKRYFHAVSELKNKRIPEKLFKENIDDINLRGKLKKAEDKPLVLAHQILEGVKEFQDKQFKITSDIIKCFNEITESITKLLKKRD